MFSEEKTEKGKRKRDRTRFRSKAELFHGLPASRGSARQCRAESGAAVFLPAAEPGHGGASSSDFATLDKLIIDPGEEPEQVALESKWMMKRFSTGSRAGTALEQFCPFVG